MARVLSPGALYDEGMKEVTGEPPCHHHGSHGDHLFQEPPFAPLACACFPAGVNSGKRPFGGSMISEVLLSQSLPTSQAEL